MNSFGTDLWLAIGLGLLTGLGMLWTVGRWLRFVGGLRRESALVDESRKRQRRILGIPLLGFAQPTPWIVMIGLPFAVYYFVYVRQSQSGAWFFGMIGFVVLCWLIGKAVPRLNVQKRHGGGSSPRVR
jgi:hypothetical protein